LGIDQVRSSFPYFVQLNGLGRTFQPQRRWCGLCGIFQRAHQKGKSRESIVRDWFDDSPLAADSTDSWRARLAIDASGNASDKEASLFAAQSQVIGTAGPKANPLLQPKIRSGRILSNELRQERDAKTQDHCEEERESPESPIDRRDVSGEQENENKAEVRFVNTALKKALQTNLRSRVVKFEGLDVTSNASKADEGDKGDQGEDKDMAEKEKEGGGEEKDKISTPQTEATFEGQEVI